MRRLIIGFLLLSLCGCGVVDYFSRKVVARAGDQVLTTEWFAETMADGTVPLNPPLLERWAWLWVQYSLFLQGLAEGQSYTDSATVLEAMWPEVLTTKVARLQERLVEQSVRVDDAVVDSAYAAGDQRIIDHILIRTGSVLTDGQNAQQRRIAERIHARLAAGASWADEVEASEDTDTKSLDGRLGIVVRGQMVAEFERAAFGLEPGGVSDVVETSYGYHILRRPALVDVSEEFETGITETLVDRWVENMLSEMGERHGVRVLPEAPEVMKDAVERPLRILALEPGRKIAEYQGGEFTDVDFVHWLQVLASEEHLAADGATNSELNEMARRVVNNHVLKIEVSEQEIELTEAEFAGYREVYERKLNNLRNTLGVDSVLARATTVEDRNRVIQEVLDRYFIRTSQSLRDIEIVPPLLAAKLRSEMDWSFYYGGLNRAIRRAVELRAARDSTTS